MDCLGCGNCADVCPGNPKKGKALTMVPFAGNDVEAARWDYLVNKVQANRIL